MKNKGGRPKGIPRSGTYGDGVKTHTVRVPQTWTREKVADLIQTLPEILEDWEERIEASPTSPRYQRARELLEELRGFFHETRL